jgi:hypothetical protein
VCVRVDSAECRSMGRGATRVRVYQCFIDATFSKARGSGDAFGCTQVGDDVKIIILIDARGLAVAVDTAPAKRDESHRGQQIFDFMPPTSGRSASSGTRPTMTTPWMQLSQTTGSRLSPRIAPTGAPTRTPKAAGRCAAAGGGGWWDERWLGCNTFAGSAFAGSAPLRCFTVPFTSLALFYCSKRFWNRF